MKNKIQIITLIVLLVSVSACKEDGKNSAKLEKLNNAYNILSEKNTKQTEEIKQLEYQNAHLQDTIKILKEKLQINMNTGANIPDSKSFQILKKQHNLSFFTKNKEIFWYAFKSTVLEKTNGILYNAIGFRYHFEGESPTNEEFVNLWNTIDRSSNSIKQLYTDNDKRYIYRLFAYNGYYKRSGLQAIVEGLLLAHKEIANDDELLNEIYTLNSTSDDWFPKQEYIDKIISEEMKDILSEINYNDSNSYIENRLFYVYSFWARRYHEGNIDIVYKIMADFHKNVKKD